MRVYAWNPCEVGGCGIAGCCDTSAQLCVCNLGVEGSNCEFSLGILFFVQCVPFSHFTCSLVFRRCVFTGSNIMFRISLMIITILSGAEFSTYFGTFSSVYEEKSYLWYLLTCLFMFAMIIVNLLDFTFGGV